MAIKSYQVQGKKFYEVYVNGFDRFGKRIQSRRKGIESIRKAEEAEFELKRELAKRKEQAVDPRWGEWVLECLSILKVQYRVSTHYSYEKTLKKWIPEAWEKRELSSFTQSQIHELIYEILPKDATQSTRKYVLKIVKKIFQMAVDLGKITKNPCYGMVVKVPEPEKKVLTNSEVETFLREAKATHHNFYPIWVVALYTGMRSGELYALKWSDVDFEAKTISVSRSWNSKNGYSCTKNQKSRIVPISEELLAFLKAYKLQRGSGRNDEFVLPHLTEWTRGEAARVIKRFCKSIGVTDIRFHDLRATFITNLLARGEPLVRVMATVGHSDMETTNVYLRKAGIEIQGATERLGYKIPGESGAQVFAFPTPSAQT
jgi:integrase